MISPNLNLTLIAALSKARVIGHQGELPWRLPKDLQLFKSLTVGKTIVMGRKTFESIGRPLPKRRNIVLSRSKCKQVGIEVCSHADEVFERTRSDEEVFVIGGEQIYRLYLPRAQRLLLSAVEGSFLGDTYFPKLISPSWGLVATKRYNADEKNAYPFTFMDIRRHAKTELKMPSFLYL